MRNYDPGKPLISIHIPKAGGTSFQEILARWFPGRLYFHYFDEGKKKMPGKHALLPGSCIHGHFNSKRGFGIRHYYPEAEQFITFLRDPFEIVVSRYFDVKAREKKGEAFRDGCSYRLPEDVGHYLRHEIHKKDYHPNILDYMPAELTLENYKDIIEERFIYMGIMEDFQNSLNHLAHALGFEPAVLGHLNRSNRYQEIPPHFREVFSERHPLEYAVYYHALRKYNIEP